jgi:hypothetical protein
MLYGPANEPSRDETLASAMPLRITGRAARRRPSAGTRDDETVEEKTAHLRALTAINPADLPHVTIGEGDKRSVRYFPERLPIGIHVEGRGALVYVVTDQVLDEFRVFLERHAPVLRALRAWTLRIVVPPDFPKIGQRAKQVVWNQLLTPLRAEVIDELRWYFEQARTHPAPSRSDDLDERFFHAREAFSGPRSRRCTGCGGRTAIGCSQKPVRARSTMQ